MSSSPRLSLDRADRLFAALAESAAGCAEAFVAAGSIRRREPTVGDVEVIAAPRYESGEAGLFGEPGEPRNLLHAWAERMAAEGRIRWVKPGRGTLAGEDLEDSEPKPHGRYWRGVLVRAHAMLDLFIPQPEGFGAQLLIRTGPSEFSRTIVTHAATVGARFQEGVLREGHDGAGPIVPCPDEDAVWRRLRLAPIPPEQRFPWWRPMKGA